MIRSANALPRKVTTLPSPRPARARPRQRIQSNGPGLPALLPAHRQFVDEILANPSEPMYRIYMRLYRKAKNRPVAANRVSRILARPEVQDYMARRGDELAEKLQKDQNDVAEELIKVGFAQITDIIAWDEEGNVTLNPSKDLSDATIAGIASIKCTQTEKTYNGETTVTRKFDIRMHDKLTALRTYLKMIGIDPNAGKPSIVQNVIVLPPEEPLEDSMARMKVFDVTPAAAGD